MLFVDFSNCSSALLAYEDRSSEFVTSLIPPSPDPLEKQMRVETMALCVQYFETNFNDFFEIRKGHALQLGMNDCFVDFDFE